MSKGKRGLVYEGYTLPKLTIKELLARNARKDSELKNFHKQLDREKEELESDFSKTRSQLLSRAHDLLLEGQTYDLGEDRSSSDDEETAFETSSTNGTGVSDSTSSWETSLFSAMKNLSNSQVAEEARSDRNPRHKQWAEKVANFEQSLTTKSESVSSKSQPRRKISWGGRANPPMENWDARSELSKASSEGNLSSGATCTLGDASHPRVRRHTVSRSKSFNTKSTGLTKEALQSHSSSTSKLLGKQRRHTVCTRGNFELKPLTPTEEEENCPVKKPLSDLLPPIKLPPIYLQESKAKEQGKKCDKNFVNKHMRIGVSKSLDAKHATEDLQYCRYLRIKKSEGNEYPW
ncbi:uncharacterized protein LOC144633843 [Oculina patagonica]